MKVEADKVGVVAHNVGSLVQNFEAPTDQVPKELTASIPRMALNDHIGRADLLEALHQQFNEGQHCLLVNGIGGVGKTCLAQAYVTRYWEDYQHVAWVNQTTGDFITDMISAEGLLDNLGVSKEGDAREVLISLMSGMKKLQDAPNLLILDNAEASLRDWVSFLPNPPHWHVLATSREKIEGFVAKELGFLSCAHAIELFKHHYTRGK